MSSYSAGLKTREKIIETASELFYTKGYESTTYAMICEKADIKQGTLHYHFDSKLTLAKCIYSRIVENLDAELEQLDYDHSDAMLSFGVREYVNLYKIYKDANYERFMTRITPEYVDNDLEMYYYTYDSILEPLCSNLTKDVQLQHMRTAACMALDMLPNFYKDVLPGGELFDNFFRYTIGLRFFALGFEAERVEHCADEVIEVMHRSNLEKLNTTFLF